MDAARPSRSFAGVLSLLTGGFAAGLVLAWFVRFWPGGPFGFLLLTNDLMEFDRLASNWVLSLLFMFGVPMFGLVALAAGTAAMGERAGKVGFALGFAAIAGYVAAMRNVWMF
jgi:hypothetical protein